MRSVNEKHLEGDAFVLQFYTIWIASLNTVLMLVMGKLSSFVRLYFQTGCEISQGGSLVSRKEECAKIICLAKCREYWRTTINCALKKSAIFITNYAQIPLSRNAAEILFEAINFVPYRALIVGCIQNPFKQQLHCNCTNSIECFRVIF